MTGTKLKSDKTGGLQNIEFLPKSIIPKRVIDQQRMQYSMWR